MDTARQNRPSVGLFVTCLVDLMRPSVGFAAVKLLEDAGCRVCVPRAQTCCGQPAYNNGDHAYAVTIARQVTAALEGFDFVVAPSGSCAGMLKEQFPILLADDPAWADRAAAFGNKVHELISFLVDVLGVERVDAEFSAKVTYHDACSGLRELGIKAQPRKLLSSVKGLELVEMQDAEICCGFGGTFCIKYPEISNAMVESKAANAGATGADLLLAGDMGCLMNMSGKIKRQGRRLDSRHVAEVLAGITDTPPIAGSGGERSDPSEAQ